MPALNIYEEARLFWRWAIELRDARLVGAAAMINELCDDLEVLAMHSEFPSIRRACESVLATA
ncbi:hypothetical protein [Hoeflea sp.]|uniref:hypothetical protein n=1 Tax=Hoeflea sp. TaxID=1940281 RepID=UPI003A90C5D9